MPSEKLVSQLFGIFAISLSLFLATKENAALGAKPRVSPYVVVIDPGHGGADTGTSGPADEAALGAAGTAVSGGAPAVARDGVGAYGGADAGAGALSRADRRAVTEKELALAISLRLQKTLQNPAFGQALGRPVKVLLTRARDETVSLEKRSEMARRARADLFVSVHANADPTGRAQGLETYFLNNTDDESSLKLQEIENRTSRRNKPGRDLVPGGGRREGRGAWFRPEEKPEEELLLRSVAADAQVEASRRSAELLHSSLAGYLRGEGISFQDRGVRQAMFYVLLDSQVPAVLVECFFLSSREDREIVARPENRDLIAEGLARGILRFLAVK